MNLLENIDPKHTLYAIKTIIKNDSHKITIGKLGTFSFQSGIYVYVGSAKRNIQARVGRHLRMEKKMRWHFDYLRPYLDVIDVTTFSGEEGECKLFQRLITENNGIIPIKRFGSSDCKCHSHLFYCQK